MKYLLFAFAITCFNSTCFASPPKTLVIVLGQTRAHEWTYQNIKTHLIDKLEADLALCVGSYQEETNNPFYQKASYHFIYNEPAEYSSTLDQAYAEILERYHLPIPDLDWRDFLTIEGNFLGGIKEENSIRKGSGAILLFFRWFLLKNLIDHNLLDKYDFFVITRSDYLYTLPHPSLELFDRSCIFVPNAEMHGGITDRHAVIPKSLMTPYLDVLPQMIMKGKEYYSALQHTPSLNLETFLLHHLKSHNLKKRILTFPGIMYTIRGEGTPTRWSEGTTCEGLSYLIKYPPEHQLALHHKKMFSEQSIKLSLEQFYQMQIQPLVTL